MDLITLGWNASFAATFDALTGKNLQPARVVRQATNAYMVHTAAGEMDAVVAGRLKDEALAKSELPTVGDWVTIQVQGGKDKVVIAQVLPRQSKFSRSVAGSIAEEQIVAANVDTVFLVSGLDSDFNLRRIERYLTLACGSGATPVILLNKSDLCDDVPARLAEAEQVASGAAVFAICAKTGDGLDVLQSFLTEGQTVAFIGSSGVGKSMIVNRLLGKEHMKVRDVRDDDKGRHTTSHRELILLPAGGMLIDTPGMRELHMWGSDQALREAFADILELAASCKFRNCAHEFEPGCAVKAAVEAGEIAAGRLEGYRKLKNEFAALMRRESEIANRADRQTSRLYRGVIKPNPTRRK